MRDQTMLRETEMQVARKCSKALEVKKVGTQARDSKNQRVTLVLSGTRAGGRNWSLYGDEVGIERRMRNGRGP